jgi:hypothetical protein
MGRWPAMSGCNQMCSQDRAFKYDVGTTPTSAQSTLCQRRQMPIMDRGSSERRSALCVPSVGGAGGVVSHGGSWICVQGGFFACPGSATPGYGAAVMNTCRSVRADLLRAQPGFLAARCTTRGTDLPI